MDYNCEIFQTLNNSVEDIKINIDRSEIINTYTKTKPSIIHGNGPSKLNLNSFANYIPNRWSEIYGYMVEKNKIELEENSKIAIYGNGVNIRNIKYDKDKIIYFTNEINYEEYSNNKIILTK